MIMNDNVKEYINGLEMMNGYLAEELSKHISYTSPTIVKLHARLAMLSEELRDELDD